MQNSFFELTFQSVRNQQISTDMKKLKFAILILFAVIYCIVVLVIEPFGVFQQLLQIEIA